VSICVFVGVCECMGVSICVCECVEYWALAWCVVPFLQFLGWLCVLFSSCMLLWFTLPRMFVAMWLLHCFADGWGDDLLLLRMGDVAGLWCSLLSLPLV